MRRLCGLGVLAWALTSGAAAARPPQTVSHVDVDRYLGKWYEIARIPNKFQAQCVSNVSAEYERRADGQLTVRNRCRRADGTSDEAQGQARIVDSASNAKLEVRFAPAWLSWLPLVWGDYWILDLAPDYSVAAVGEPRREYLWILSRTPQIADRSYEEIVKRMAAQGYDSARLVRTQQE